MITIVKLGDLTIAVGPQMLGGGRPRVYISIEGPSGGDRGSTFAEPEAADALALALAGSAGVVRAEAEQAEEQAEAAAA